MMVKFKEKNFGLLGDMAKGAAIGTAVGGGMTKFYLGGKKSKVIEFGKEESDKDKKPEKSPDTSEKPKTRRVELNAQAGAIAGAVVGAALGAIASGIKAASFYINRKKTVDNRLMRDIVKSLENRGHKEGMSFTRDPRKADLLKTKVSIVVYKYSDELRIVVNSVSDPKLDKISQTLTERLAKTQKAIYNEEISGKYKDLKITAISDPSTDAEVISWVASTFIENGYPVYLVEVG